MYQVPRELLELIDAHSDLGSAVCLRCSIRGLEPRSSTWRERLHSFTEAPTAQRMFLARSYFLDGSPAVYHSGGSWDCAPALQWASELYIGGLVDSVVLHLTRELNPPLGEDLPLGPSARAVHIYDPQMPHDDERFRVLMAAPFIIELPSPNWVAPPALATGLDSRPRKCHV